MSKRPPKSEDQDALTVGRGRRRRTAGAHQSQRRIPTMMAMRQQEKKTKKTFALLCCALVVAADYRPRSGTHCATHSSSASFSLLQTPEIHGLGRHIVQGIQASNERKEELGEEEQQKERGKPGKGSKNEVRGGERKEMASKKKKKEGGHRYRLQETDRPSLTHE
jgi:hypothetical protein